MLEAVSPTSMGFLISIGASLLAVFLSLVVTIRSSEGVAVKRDTAVWTLFGAAFVLTFLTLIAAARLAVWGMAYLGLLKAALLLTAAFAIVGMLFGLLRGLRSRQAIKP
jgi:hypothetical protein